MKATGKQRNKLINFVKRKISEQSFPRLQISMILVLTALAGFLASFALLRAGISSMTLRYPVAIAAAYCVFLLLLRVWIWLQRNRADFDLPGIDFGGDSGSANSPASNFEFAGGDFGGGGAGGNWGEGVSSAAAAGDNSILDGVSFDFDLEEFGLLIVAAIAIIGGLLAAFYIIYIAPLLLAEITVDAILVAGLYKRVKKIEPAHWLQTAFRRTIVPMLLTTILFTVAGFAMQRAVPEANSLGAVWTRLSR